MSGSPLGNLSSYPNWERNSELPGRTSAPVPAPFLPVPRTRRRKTPRSPAHLRAVSLRLRHRLPPEAPPTQAPPTPARGSGLQHPLPAPTPLLAGAFSRASAGPSLRDPPWVAAPLKPEASGALPRPADFAPASTVGSPRDVGVALPSPPPRPLPHSRPPPRRPNFFFS